MKNDHSPAPWSAIDPDVLPFHAPLEIIDAEGNPVATIAQSGDSDADNANGALIIAAPDLLAFARWIAEDPCECSASLDTMEAEPCLMCRAASLVKYAETSIREEPVLPGEAAAADQERLHDGRDPL